MFHSKNTNLNLDNIFIKFNQTIIKSSKELIFDPIKTIKNSPKLFLHQLENKIINLKILEKDVLLKIFNYACNMLKEIEREEKVLGLKIMEYLVDSGNMNEDLFLNAYVFEKTSAKNFSTHSTFKKRFISVGDYELAKYDQDSVGVNYGFFAAPLEEEKKEIKIKTLDLISKIGLKLNNKEFSIKSFKYTIELVNDEEDEVRYSAINCLEKLIETFKIIDFNSCEIIFFNIKEKSFNLRKSLYYLISKLYFEKEEEFSQSVKSLCENLKLFPEDKLLIFECMKSFVKNNSSFITNEYISNLFNLDTNFLVPEFNWNDIEYNSHLIIFQEFMKSKQFRVKINLPKFFIKHFNYLSDKYPNIYDKNVYKYLSRLDADLNNDEDSEMNNLTDKTILNLQLEEDLNQIFNYFKNVKTNENLKEVYKMILSVIKINEQEDSINYNYAKFIIISGKIINLLEIINFQLYIKDDEDSSELNQNIIHLNNILQHLIIENISNKFDVELSFSKDKNNLYKESINHFNQTTELKKSIKTQSNLNLINKIFSYIENKNSNFFNNNIIEVKITNPKNNFNYVHIKNRMGIISPFFLQINIKFKNTFNLNNNLEIFLAKNIIILITKFQKQKKVDLDPSMIKANLKEITIKTKAPIYIIENESGEYSINVYIKSKIKSEFKTIIEKLNIEVYNMTEYIPLNEEIKFTITY